MKSPITYLVILLAAICAVATGCQTTAAKQGVDLAQNGGNIFTCEVNEGLSYETVKQVVLMSLAERQWKVVEESDGVVSAELDATAKRGIYGHVVVKYTDKVITITDNSVDSKGCPFVSIRWDKYLIQSLQKYMREAVIQKAATK